MARKKRKNATVLGRPRLEEAGKIERKLLVIALKEFHERGYGGASMNAIARAAQVSKTTLYSRFPSKESLFRAIMHEQIERVGGRLTLHPTNARPELAEGLKSYANYMIGLSFKGELLRVNRLIYGEAERFPELGAAAADRNQLGVTHIANFIQQCAAADRIPCKDAQSVAEAFIYMIRGWYVNAMLTTRKVSAAERERWVDRAVNVLVSARREW
jgi:TetR/AcrR family transcriptional repressor of mexJK operon